MNGKCILLVAKIRKCCRFLAPVINPQHINDEVHHLRLHIFLPDCLREYSSKYKHIFARTSVTESSVKCFVYFPRVTEWAVNTPQSSEKCRYISRPVGQGVNTMTESLLQWTAKKTVWGREQQRGYLTLGERKQGLGECSVLQSERYDCFSVPDENLFLSSEEASPHR